MCVFLPTQAACISVCMAVRMCVPVIFNVCNYECVCSVLDCRQCKKENIQSVSYCSNWECLLQPTHTHTHTHTHICGTFSHPNAP